MDRYILSAVFNDWDVPLYVGTIEWDEMNVNWEFDEELAGIFNGQEVDNLLSYAEFKDIVVEPLDV